MSYFYSLDGVTGPPGGPKASTAADALAPSVSAPSLGYPNGAWSEVWFRFVAGQRGKVMFDSTLSYNLQDSDTSSNVELTLFESDGTTDLETGYTGVNDLGFTVNRGQVTWDVTEGTTYYVRLHRAATAWTTAMILRITDYAASTDWGTLPDTEFVIVPPSGPLYNNDLVPPYLATVSVWHQPDYLISGGGFGTYGIGHCQKWDRGFFGIYQLQQSFGGPRPGDDPSAWTCAWSWARKGNWDGQFWSLHPLGDSGFVNYSWNGTDPYNPDIPGGGTCIVWDGTIDSRDDTNPGLVQFRYGSDAGGGFSTAFAHFDSRNPCQRLKVSQIALQAGEAGGGAYPTPPSGYEDAELEWEDPSSTLIGLDAAADEGLIDGSEPPDGNGTGGLSVEWYLKATANDENPLPVGLGGVRNWGPDRQDDQWVGNDTGPSTLDADVVLPPYSGGSASWVPLSSGIISDAMTYETAGAESGLRAVAVAPEQLTDTVPSQIFPTAPPETLEAFRLSYVAFRAHLRPSRYRWIPAPVLPPVDPKVSTITGLPDENRRRFAP